ncbi:hypothetical protein EGW08_003600, partial [Elysia chlorotica]
DGRCVPVSTGICPGLSSALLPNEFGHKAPETALLEFLQFEPLFRVGCSPQLAPFLCGRYLPECKGQPLVPCRSLCEKAIGGCMPLLQKFYIKWPEALDCAKLPTSGNCYGGGRPGGSRPGGRPKFSSCVEFSSDFCPGMPYETAAFPNLLSQKSPTAANLTLAELQRLVQTGCSPYLADFLCGVNFPECRGDQMIAPCRSLCTKAYEACADTVREKGFTWPRVLNCHQFPS